MKKTRILALLLVAVLVVATLCAGLTASAADENVAKGKSYVISQQFRQGGADVNWGWDDNADYAYPDTDGVELTDGIIAANDAKYDDPEWVGFTNKAPEYENELGYSYIRVDLGAEYDLSKLVLYVGTTFLKNGIGATNMTVSYYKVDDMKGANATLIAEETPVDDETVAAVAVAAELSTPVTAQYVEIRMVRGGWMFITEFEAYGAKAGGSTGTTSSTPSDDSSAPADDSSAPADDSSAPADTSSTAPATSSTAPATSSTAPATSTTSKVPTGDAGMIGFAVLALVAIAGVAVAVKVRH